MQEELKKQLIDKACPDEKKAKVEGGIETFDELMEKVRRYSSKPPPRQEYTTDWVRHIPPKPINF